MGKVNIRFLVKVTWQPTPQGNLVLKEGEVHAYRINIAANLHAIPSFNATLNAEEIERGSKYFQQKDRQRFIVSRGAHRSILARYLNKLPAKIEFAIGNNKKPRLLNGDGPGIQYNISHAGQWILLVIAKTDIGADVEYIDQRFAFRDILEEHFSADEVAFINQKDPVDRFFKLWTRKEAFLKATGQGLGGHLRQTTSLDGEHVLPGNLLGCEKNWQVFSFDLYSGYTASITTENNNCQLMFYDINF